MTSYPWHVKMFRITTTIGLEQYQVKQMRNYSGVILVSLFIAVIFTAGCMNQTAPETPVPVPNLTISRSLLRS